MRRMRCCAPAVHFCKTCTVVSGSRFVAPHASPSVASQLRCHRSGRADSCVVLLRLLGPVAA